MKNTFHKKEAGHKARFFFIYCEGIRTSLRAGILFVRSIVPVSHWGFARHFFEKGGKILHVIEIQ